MFDSSIDDLASFQKEERMQLKQLKNGNSEGRRLFNQKNKKVSTVFFNGDLFYIVKIILEVFSLEKSDQLC